MFVNVRNNYYKQYIAFSHTIERNMDALMNLKRVCPLKALEMLALEAEIFP